MTQRHPFHIVKPSPWPFLVSVSLFLMIVEQLDFMADGDDHLLVCLFHAVLHHLTHVAFVFFLSKWFLDIVIEGTYEGHHTLAVQRGLKLGFVFFLFSEVMFFAAFFAAYFYFSVSPSIEIGNVWPPDNIKLLNPFGIPLLNTVILLTSGITVTWAHHSLISDKPFKNKTNARAEVIFSLALTVILGCIFTYLQLYEYQNTTFSISTTVYGSIFFLLTGFHGFHVIIGTIFLTVCFFRHVLYHFTNTHHVGFETAIWYWHFVDIIWLLLYIIIYLSEYI